MYRKLVTDLVADAVNSLIGDLNEIVTFQSFTGNVYNPDTRKNTPTFTDVEDVATACYKFRADEKDTTVNVITDERCLIPSKNITGFVPKETDRIVKSTGEVWEAFRVKGVPGQSLYILYIRKVKP